MIPEVILLHKNLGLVEAYLDGYVEGDGYLGAKRNRPFYGCITTSKILALQLQLLLARLGVLATISKSSRKPTGVIEGRKINQSPAYQITFRRQEAIKKQYFISEDHIAVPVRSVTLEPYHGDVFNLETTSHHYLVSNAITHNCDRPDEREFVTFNYSQLLNQIVRHKAAHVKADLRSVMAQQRRAPSPQRPLPSTAPRRPFIFSYSPRRRALPP